MDKEFEEKVDQEVREELNSYSIYEDMLGYINYFNDTKKKILKEKYNIDYEIKEEDGCTYD